MKRAVGSGGPTSPSLRSCTLAESAVAVHGQVFWFSEPWPVDSMSRFNELTPTLSLWAFLRTTGPDPDPDLLIWLLGLMSDLSHCYGLVYWRGKLAGYHYRHSLLLFGCCGTLSLPVRPVLLLCCLLFTLTEQPTLAFPWTQQLISMCWNTKCLLERLEQSHTENMKQNC